MTSKSMAMQLATLTKLARSLGYALTPLQKIKKEVGLAIATRMRRSVGTHVYQTVNMCLHSIPRQAIIQLLDAQYLTPSNTQRGTMTWKANTMADIVKMVSPFLCEASTFCCAGASRVLMTKSEKVVRLVSMLIPSVEFTHTETTRGVDRLYVDFQYVVADHTGELHKPKDQNRNEVALARALENKIRKQLLSDLRKLGELGAPLSPQFWRQLGQEQKAQEAEATLFYAAEHQNQLQLQRVRKTSREIEMIRDMRTIQDRRVQYLVEWKGFHPSWEAWRANGPGGALGTPLLTWEDGEALQNTVALAAWKQAQEA